MTGWLSFHHMSLIINHILKSVLQCSDQMRFTISSKKSQDPKYCWADICEHMFCTITVLNSVSLIEYESMPLWSGFTGKPYSWLPPSSQPDRQPFINYCSILGFIYSIFRFHKRGADFGWIFDFRAVQRMWSRRLIYCSASSIPLEYAVRYQCIVF